MQELWFEVLIVRTTVVDQIRGGLASLFGALLDLFFAQDHNLRLAGVRLPGDAEALHAFFSLHCVVADEAALHAMYACKGSSGLRPCLLCKNVFNRRNQREVLQHDTTGVAVTHDCTEWDALRLHSTGSLRAVARRLRQEGEAGGPQSALDELQTRLGWTFVPESVLFTDRWMSIADPSRHVAFDYMHCWLVGGIFNHEVGRALLALREFGVTAEKVHQYLAVWHWPASVKGSTGQDAFGPKRAKASLEAGILKATASECLSLWPVLAQFFFGVLTSGTVSAAARPHLECFLLLARVLQLLLSTSRKLVPPDALRTAIQAHLRKYKEVYGPEAMVPKFHYALHFPTFLDRMGFLQAAFVLERKHKLPKRFRNQVHTIISKRCLAQPHLPMGLARYTAVYGCIRGASAGVCQFGGSLSRLGRMLATRGETRTGRKRGRPYLKTHV